MKILASIGLFAFVVMLSFPISAHAFGKRPDSSEVNQNHRTHTGPVSKKTLTDSPNETTPQAVPEPSSMMLFGIAMGLLGLVSIKTRLRKTTEQ